MRRHSLSPSGPSHPPQDDLKAAGLTQQVSTNVLREPIVAGLHGAGSYPQSRRAHPLAGCLAALWGHAVWRARLLSGVGAAAIRLDLGPRPAQRGAAIRSSLGCTAPCARRDHPGVTATAHAHAAAAVQPTTSPALAEPGHGVLGPDVPQLPIRTAAERLSMWRAWPLLLTHSRQDHAVPWHRG